MQWFLGGIEERGAPPSPQYKKNPHHKTAKQNPRATKLKEMKKAQQTVGCETVRQEDLLVFWRTKGCSWKLKFEISSQRDCLNRDQNMQLDLATSVYL